VQPPNGWTRLLRSGLELRGLCVLAVDDEDDPRDVLAAILDSCGVRVVTARSAEDAMLVLERESPDVSVSDIGMPEANG